MKSKISFLYFLLLCNLNIFAQTKEANLDKYFTSLVENRKFNGNVLIAENGKLIYEKSFGYADFANKSKNTAATAFPIASISKTITATAILQLQQSGKLKVSDAVTKYIPDFPYPNIRIQNLLSHTSGLPPYNAYFDSVRKKEPSRVFTNADFMKGLIANPKPLIYQPGERQNYDNINFIVLALLIEKLSGEKFSDYIQKHVLQPAGMTHTILLPLTSQYNRPIGFPIAYPHLYPHLFSDSIVKSKEVPYIVSYWSSYNFSGFGDYVSTTHDLLNYDQAYYNGSLLHNESLYEMFEPIKLNNNTQGDFGLGWQVGRDTTLGKIVFHSGAATGLSCVLIRNITKHQTIILFDNTHDNAQAVGMAALKILNGLYVAQPKKSIASIYARTLLRSGPAKARDTLYLMAKDTLNYQLSEDEMNSLGYDFMGGINNPNPFRFPEVRMYQEAAATFKLNMQLFPESWNVYDSYGEVLLKLGQKEEAIKMYKKSVELNPKNDGGKKILEELIK